MLQRRLGLLLLALTALVWSRSLGGDYVWDDLDNLLYSGQLRKWSAVWESFLHDAMWSANKEQATVGTYRPLSLATFAFDLNLFGVKPVWLHLTSLLWHLSAVGAVFVLLGRFVPPVAAFGITLLWAIHPTAAEAVTWINGRSEVLAMVFGASAAALATAPRGRFGGPAGRPLSIGRLVAVSFCLLFAMLGKETGLVFIPITVWLAGEADGRAAKGWIWRRIHWPVAAAAFVAMGVYLALRANALAGGAAAGVLDNARMEALLAWPAIWLKCFQAVTVPFEISIHHLSAWLEVAGPEWRWAGIGLLVVQALIFFKLWWSGQRPAAVGLAWWCATLVPVALIGVLGWPGLHRWLYIGMPGLFWSLYAVAGARLPRKVGIGLLALLAVLFAAQTQRAITAWGHGGRIFAAMVDEHPESSFGRIGLGAWLLEHGKPDEAETVLRVSVDSPNTRIDAYDFLGRSVAAQGRCEEAWRVYHIWTADNAPPAISWAVGACYEKRNDGARALYWYNRCDYGVCTTGRAKFEGKYAVSDDPGPEVPAPGTVPASEPPLAELPEGDAPEGEAPEGEAPEGEAPEGEAPEGEAPEGATPASKG